MRHFLLSATLMVGGAHAQSAACPDAADESHHQVLYQNDSTRVLLLDLPRLASTASHCHPHRYLYLYMIAAAGRSSNTVQGQGNMSHYWYGGEARFV